MSKAQVVVTKKNEVHMHIEAEPYVLQEISDHFTFTVPGSQFHPKVKAKLWDGKIRLFSMWTGELYLGLLPKLHALCERNEYALVNNVTITADQVSYDDFYAFVETLNLTARGEDIEARDYQLDAAYQAITRGRTLLLSPTASGKSLIIYLVMRWHMAKGRRQLIIVPTTSLCHQLMSDFVDYTTSEKNEMSVENRASIVMGGMNKTPTKKCLLVEYENGITEYLFPDDVVLTENGKCAISSLSAGDSVYK